MKTFKDERKLREFFPIRHILNISNRKKMIKERILAHQERIKNKGSCKSLDMHNGHPLLHEFYKSYLMRETIITPSDTPAMILKDGESKGIP